VVGAATLSSRFLGLARDVAMAHLMGANGNADAFFVAFKIPNFLRRLFAEGAFAQAFVPVLAETREQGGLAAVKALVDRVAGMLAGTLLLLTMVAVFAAPVIAWIFAPGFSRDPAKMALTAELIRITFPYLLLISLTGFAGGILNTYGRFAVPALTPLLLNLSLLGAAFYGASGVLQEPVYALAWGVFVAGIAQLLFQIPSLVALKLLPRPRWDWHHSGVRRILTLMVPALFGVSVSQINLLLDTVLASLLPNGSVSWLYYSDRLTELPLGVFGIAIATVILPALSRLKAIDDSATFSATLHWAVQGVWVIAAPAMVALLILAEPILATLFHYGEFGDTDLRMASASLRAYTLGLAAFMLIKVLAPGFYARQDTRTPVKIGIMAMISNMVLNPLFIFPLMWFANLGHVGLALATSASAWLNAVLLWRGLRRQGAWVSGAEPSLLFWRLPLAVALMGTVLWFVTPVTPEWLAGQWWERVLQLVLLCGLGFVLYAGALLALGVRLRHFRSP
jgi:putative peptidoglycan lipid II flippase